MGAKLAVILAVMFFSACGGNSVANQRAVDACISLGGVPLFGQGSDMVRECMFKPACQSMMSHNQSWHFIKRVEVRDATE